MNTQNEIWIGLVGLQPLSTNTVVSSTQKVYTNILLFAKNRKDYKEKVHKFTYELDFEVFEIEDAERLTNRLKKMKLMNPFQQLLNALKIQVFLKLPHFMSLRKMNSAPVERNVARLSGHLQCRSEHSQICNLVDNKKISRLYPTQVFIILYRITGRIKPAEYDYTHKYIPK